MLQFAAWYENGAAVLSDGRRLTELPTGIHAPTMLVIGSDDRLASIADQRTILHLLPSKHKEMLLLSRKRVWLIMGTWIQSWVIEQNMKSGLIY